MSGRAPGHTGRVPDNDDVHPDLRRTAHLAPRRLVGPRTLPIMRALIGLTGRAVPGDVEVIALGPGAGVRLYRGVGVREQTPALLWIHGGGYVLGKAAQDDRLCRQFGRTLGITVASVEYRLAPEHPYPAPLEDCYSALRWLAELPWVDRDRIAIGGASAGGGLAAALALLARDRAEIAPALQLLTYPMLDDRSSTTRTHPRYRLWDARANRFGWAAYLGNADPALAVPSRREDLSGLAPAWIGVGTHDLFHDEDLDYARRLAAAGVPCQVDVVPGAFHGFDLVAPNALVSQQFFARQCEVLRAALAPAG
ncbi:Carboxylesterase NlhH [Mycobacterium attenuatum]|nr:Carboxylesterase NlhH [Mycobacterium attenuatum]VBA46393.1 Carboxylesterase NlhH [Mycobacterium attenuatum]